MNVDDELARAEEDAQIYGTGYVAVVRQEDGSMEYARIRPPAVMINRPKLGDDVCTGCFLQLTDLDDVVITGRFGPQHLRCSPLARPQDEELARDVASILRERHPDWASE